MKRNRLFKLRFENIFFIIVMVVLLVYCISLLVPIFWAVLSSFKGIIEYEVNPFGFPKEFLFSNYAEIPSMMKVNVLARNGNIVRYGMFPMFINSFVEAGLPPLVTLFFTTLVAYVLSKYNFVGKNFIYNLGIIVMIIPIVGNLPSAMMVAKTLGTYNNLFLNIAFAPSNIFGMNFLIMYGAFKSIPWEYAESAQLDGASDWTIMLKIMLPMVIPTFAVLFALAFLGAWNDYLTPMIWLPSYPNLAYGLYYFQYNASSLGASMPHILAGFIIVMVPTALLFFAMQKVIMAKFTVGGLKG